MTLAICTHLNWRSYVSNSPDGSSLRMYISCAGAAMYLERANGVPGLNQLVACPPLMPLLICRWKSKSWSWCRLISISDFGLFYRYKILPCVLWSKMTRQNFVPVNCFASYFTGTKFCLLFTVFYEATFCTCKRFLQFYMYKILPTFGWVFTRQNFVPVNFWAVLLAIIFASDSEAEAGIWSGWP